MSTVLVRFSIIVKEIERKAIIRFKRKFLKVKEKFIG